MCQDHKQTAALCNNHIRVSNVFSFSTVPLMITVKRADESSNGVQYTRAA